MKLVFVYWGFENAGSMLDLKGYARAAEAAGHQVTVYGPPGHVFALAGGTKRHALIIGIATGDCLPKRRGAMGSS